MTKRFQEYYVDFASNREQIGFCGAALPYRWVDFPDVHGFESKLDVARHLWCEIAEFQILDIANAINSLSVHARNFDAWCPILRDLDRHEAFRVYHEFISSSVAVSLGLPYSIKSRFYFAISHLSHQANRFVQRDEWSEDALPPDREISQEVAARLTRGWKAWRKIEKKLNGCNSRVF